MTKLASLSVLSLCFLSFAVSFQSLRLGIAGIVDLFIHTCVHTGPFAVALSSFDLANSLPPSIHVFLFRCFLQSYMLRRFPSFEAGTSYCRFILHWNNYTVLLRLRDMLRITQSLPTVLYTFRCMYLQADCNLSDHRKL